MIRKRSPGMHFATERTWLGKAPLRTRLFLRRDLTWRSGLNLSVEWCCLKQKKPQPEG